MEIEAEMEIRVVVVVAVLIKAWLFRRYRYLGMVSSRLECYGVGETDELGGAVQMVYSCKLKTAQVIILLSHLAHLIPSHPIHPIPFHLTPLTSTHLTSPTTSPTHPPACERAELRVERKP